MTHGTNTSWVRGERTVTERKGKHGGPSVKQNVVKVLTPKQ